jgi:hypothetical protein
MKGMNNLKMWESEGIERYGKGRGEGKPLVL